MGGSDFETYKIDDHTIGVRPKWIKCSDRLPPEDLSVLIYCSPYILMDKRTNPKDGNIWACTNKEDVTHWMPLPEAPHE
jgi:hypothetical protein